MDRRKSSKFDRDPLMGEATREERERACEMCGFRWSTALLWVFVVAALVIAIVGIAKAYAAQSKQCTAEQLVFKGRCDNGTAVQVSPTVGARLCRDGEERTLIMPAFTCDGTLNTSSGPGPLLRLAR